MNTCYYKRIENRQRIRMKVQTEDNTASLTIVTYSLPDNSLYNASWTKETRNYDLTDTAQQQAFASFLEGFEKCPRWEFRYALQETQKKYNHSKPDAEDAPVPVSEIQKRIQAFLSNKKTSQA